jgi:hypothetical protein
MIYLSFCPLPPVPEPWSFARIVYIRVYIRRNVFSLRATRHESRATWFALLQLNTAGRPDAWFPDIQRYPAPWSSDKLIFLFFICVNPCWSVVENCLSLFLKTAYSLKLTAYRRFHWRPMATNWQYVETVGRLLLNFTLYFCHLPFAFCFFT